MNDFLYLLIGLLAGFGLGWKMALYAVTKFIEDGQMEEFLRKYGKKKTPAKKIENIRDTLPPPR